MLGVTVNALAIIIGSLIGLGGKKFLPEKVTNAVMIGVGLSVLIIGIDGALEPGDTLIMIASIVIGTIIGTLLDIDGAVNRLGQKVEEKTSRGSNASVAQGFVTGTLLFCVGAMMIVGSLDAGLYGDNTILFAKSMLDFISSIMLTASLGYGVIFSSVAVFLLQGSVALLAGVLQPILTEAAITEMSRAGSLMIMALGLNMMGITKIKVADFLPGLIVAPLLCWVVGLF